MTTEQIEFSEEQAEFIREVVSSGRYQDINEVVRVSVHLLEERLAQQKTKEEELRKMLEEAQESGISDRSARDVWEEVIARYRKSSA